MNNPRLLTALLAAMLVSAGAHADAPEPQVYTLDEIFRAAEEHSAQLRPFFTAEQEARHDISVAKAERLPEFNASLSVSYIGNGFTVKRDFSDYQKAPIPHLGTGLSLYVEQPLYTGGAIPAGIEIAELKSCATRYATDFQRDNVRFRLAGFYLDIYKYSNLRMVVERNIALAQHILTEMRARHEQGTVLLNDISRYELLLANYELELVRIDNTLEILNSNLTATAGLPEGTTIVPDSTILAQALPRSDEDWWQTQAETHSPLLRMARSSLDINRKAENLAKAERLPKIGLQAGWNMDGPILVEIPPINRNLSYWCVGMGVRYNISSLYKSNHNISKRRTATQLAKERLDAQAQDVEQAIRADHIRYMEAYEELKSRQKSVELAERNYRTTATRYSADMALITDMLDAANARIEAEQQLVNARINIIYYYYKLLFTSGNI